MESIPAKIVFRALIAAILLWALVSHLPYLRANVAQRDSIAYWAAGDLLLRNQNPYDAGAVLTVETAHGYHETKPLVLRTPPWSLLMVLPLGLVGPFWAWMSWIALSIASLLLTMRLCWKMYGGPDVSQNLFWIVGYAFAPVAACLVAGQMGLVLALGMVLFLWIEPDHPLLAGVVLLLPFAKPHLLSGFWLVFALWVVTRRRYLVGTGLALSIVVASALALALDPGIFVHYREMLSRSSMGTEFIPAISGVLRLLFFRRFFWVQFIPLVLGLAWSIRFYVVHRSDWNWRQHGPILLIVSVLTTPYSWLTDEVVLLPAVLQAIVYMSTAKDRLPWATRLVLILFACLNGLLLLILAAKVPFATGIYFWSSLVWFGFYTYSRRYARRHGSLELAHQVLASST